MTDADETVTHRIAQRLYKLEGAWDASRVTGQQRLIEVLQDVLDELIVSTNKEGFDKACHILNVMRVELDAVMSTLSSAAMVVHHLERIKP